MIQAKVIIRNMFDAIRLPFRREKQLYRSLYNILGFYPGNIELYQQALMHKSAGAREKSGRRTNNERLEFLGDAILDAVVGDIVFKKYQYKPEGFLTTTRSKIVKRDTLGKLADQLGLTALVHCQSRGMSHNSYMGGNAFEALVGAIYLDRGYQACLFFMKERILGKYLSIDRIAFSEANFKSRLLEWSQKYHLTVTYELIEEGKTDSSASPYFVHKVLVNGIECGIGRGYTKKESQQLASKAALKYIQKHESNILNSTSLVASSETPGSISDPGTAVTDEGSGAVDNQG